MKKILTKTITLAGVLLATAAGAETIIANEFWICDSANTGNLGTLDNPYDGSTRAKFDTVMDSMPPHSTVHILAGTYETWGCYAWGAKSGEKIIGSGMDNTILQFPAGTPQGTTGNFIIGSAGAATNIEVSDLTCDCNWNGNGDTFGGVGLDGARNAVRRVKVIHCGFTPGTNTEAFAIVLSNDHLPASEGNIIEECEVSEFSGGHNITAFSLNGGANGTWISGIMRNNRVFLSPDPEGAQIAFNGSWEVNSLIAGNYVDGADVGVYGDTGGCTNMTIAQNFLTDSYQGVTYSGHYARANVTIDFNQIWIMPSTAYANTVFSFWGGMATNVIIIGNNIGFCQTGANSAFLMAADNLTGLLMGNNAVDSSLADNQATTPYFTHVSNVSMYNNNDLFGNYLPGLNIPSIGGTEVTPFGLSLLSSATPAAALTNLGLLSNPLVVVTNSGPGVASSGTSSGDGSSLANVPVPDSFTNSPMFWGSGPGQVAFSLFSTNLYGASYDVVAVYAGTRGARYWDMKVQDTLIDPYPAADWAWYPVDPDYGDYPVPSLVLITNGSAVVGNTLIATNGFQCSTNYTPSLWTPVPGSVILRASNNWMYAITQFSTNAAFKIGP